MIFLAPTVPLVIQQSQYLHDTTPLKVKSMYGAMNIDSVCLIFSFLLVDASRF
jgi:hypothetical protein